MGFVKWVKNLFNGKKELSLSECVYNLGIDYYYKKIAVDTCIDLIANSISQCEFQTYKKGKSVRENNYYLLNVRPNKNQNATEFFHKLVTKLVYDNECLVVMIDDQLLVADDYTVEEYALKDNIYKNVSVGDLTFKDTFFESKVMHFKLRNERIIEVIDGMYESLGKLLVSTINYYKRKNNKRLLIKGDFLRAQDDETQKAIDEMFEGQLKNWFDPDTEGSAFQLQEGYELDDMSDGTQSANGNSGLSRDIADLINDIINYVSMAFHVPRGLVKGDVVELEGQIDSFLMFGINPITENIKDEFNGKMYTKEEFLERTYLKIDTTQIKVTDITKLATALDKLFAIGGITINGIIERLGGEPIDEEWANTRYVTKNYERADAIEGGDE